MAKKVSPMTDIKSLPRWQKYTIIAILFMLALAFTMSGAMVAVINAVTKKSGLPMGKIDGTSVEYEDYYNYYSFYSRIFAMSQNRQGGIAKSLLFSKMPVKSDTGEIQTFFDSYYIDYVANSVKNLAKDDDENNLSTLVTDKLAWNHLLLLRLAEKNGVSISDESAKEIARELLLGPPEKPTLPEDNQANTNQPKPETEEEKAQEKISRTKRLTEIMQQNLQQREAQYQTQLETLFAQNSQYVMSSELFEKIVKECVMIKRYMDNVIADNVKITRKDILENIDSFKSEMKLEYMRIKSDDPEVVKRAKAKLADELAMLALKRNVWESGNIMSAEELFADPLMKIYNAKIESEDKKFSDPKYIVKVIASEFKDMGSYVVVPDEIIKKFYDHFKLVFFKNDRTESDINEQLDKEKEELIKDHSIEMPKPENGEKPEWAPVEGWDKWREKRKDELSCKPFEEVKDEAQILARKMATPKFAATAIKKLHDEIQKRIQKNREANEKTKQTKQVILNAWQQLERVIFESDQADGAIDLVKKFRATILEQLETVRKSCSLTYDEDGEAVKNLLEVKYVTDALIKAWNEIDFEQKLLLINIKFTKNPYVSEGNQIADTSKELESLRGEIDRLKNSNRVDDFMRLEELEQNEQIIAKRLELLTKLRAELMTTLDQLKESFRQAIVISESFDENFSVSKGFLDSYLNNFETQILNILDGFNERMKIEEIAEEINDKVQALEVDMKKFEAESEDLASNLSKELPPESILNLKVDQFPFSELGVKVHTIEMSKVYRGLSINGLWGAGISPYEFVSTMSVEDMKNNPWLQENMPYLLNAKVWDFQKNTTSGDSFEDVLGKLKVGQYSEPIGVMGVGVYILYLEEKLDNDQPDFDDVKDELIQDYIDQNVSEIAKEYALEIREEIVDTYNKILDGNKYEVIEIAKKYMTEEAVTNLKDKYSGANPLDLIKLKKLVAAESYAGIAKEHNIEIMQTDYVNVNSDIEDIAYDSDSDKDFISGCMLLAPYFELSDLAKETRPDETRDTETNASYIFARIIGQRKPMIKGSSVDPTDITEEEIDLLYENLWAQKVLASKEVMDLTNTGKLVKILNEKGIETEVFKDKINEASPNRGQ